MSPSAKLLIDSNTKGDRQVQVEVSTQQQQKDRK